MRIKTTTASAESGIDWHQAIKEVKEVDETRGTKAAPAISNTLRRRRLSYSALGVPVVAGLVALAVSLGGADKETDIAQVIAPQVPRLQIPAHAAKHSSQNPSRKVSRHLSRHSDSWHDSKPATKQIIVSSVDVPRVGKSSRRPNVSPLVQHEVAPQAADQLKHNYTNQPAVDPRISGGATYNDAPTIDQTGGAMASAASVRPEEPVQIATGGATPR